MTLSNVLEGGKLAAPLRAIVMGGSLAGLNAALWLQHVGYDVLVFERSPKSLFGRGAGILLSPFSMRSLQLGNDSFDANKVSLHVDNFRFACDDPEDDVKFSINFRFTSYNSLLAAYQSRLKGDRYHLNRCVVSIAQDENQVTVGTSDGETNICDLLVCADGTTSDARRILNVPTTTQYSGYIAWRGIVPEHLVPEDMARQIRPSLTYNLREDSHIISYPIPYLEESGDTVIYLNWLWYRHATGSEFSDVMTDVDGVLRERSMPPGKVQPKNVAKLRNESLVLPQTFKTLIEMTKHPFIQALYDVSVDKMAHGRVCIIGDAAFTPRPHIAVATAKAAEDGRYLSENLVQYKHNVVRALQEWEGPRLELGKICVRRSQKLGDMLQSGQKDRKDAIRYGLYKAGDSELDENCSTPNLLTRYDRMPTP